MKKEKGFTLIELLAVIIILGVLMIIAVPAVTKYINDSRKSGYVTTAKSIVRGVSNLANSDILKMNNTNTTYYIPASYIKTENELTSPYGTLTEAYVGVIFNYDGYTYFWVSRDETGTGVIDITPIEKLDTNDIESNIEQNEITTKVRTTGIGNRLNIKILKADGTWESIALSNINNNIGEDGNIVDNLVYPPGKNRSKVVVGDLVSIGDEEFYVVKKQGKNLVLIAHYNLKIGEIYNGDTWEKIGEYSVSDPGYGLQSSEALGRNESGPSTGTVAFTSSSYWDAKIGTDYPGVYCDDQTTIPSEGCAYVYDSNSTLYSYVNNYKEYLEGLGATIKEARLLKVEEAIELGCTMNPRKCDNVPNFLKETSYWLGSPNSDVHMWLIVSDGSFGSMVPSGNAKIMGLRPVIVV